MFPNYLRYGIVFPKLTPGKFSSQVAVSYVLCVSINPTLRLPSSQAINHMLPTICFDI